MRNEFLAWSGLSLTLCVSCCTLVVLPGPSFSYLLHNTKTPPPPLERVNKTEKRGTLPSSTSLQTWSGMKAKYFLRLDYTAFSSLNSRFFSYICTSRDVGLNVERHFQHQFSSNNFQFSKTFYALPTENFQNLGAFLFREVYE